MPLKRTRIITYTALALCLVIGLIVYVFKHRISSVYDSTIQPTSFQDVVLEKDTAANSTFPVKNLPADSSISGQFINSTSSGNSSTSSPFNRLSTTKNKTQQDNAVVVSTVETSRKGKEIKASDIPLLHAYNSRVRLTTFLSKFKQGDYISGSEFANLYRRDPSIGKVAKGTICNFIEKNINKLTRIDNSFVIQTNDPNGVHMKLKIPFVEELRINVENGAQVIVGETFTSKAPAFNKSILLPIQLQSIDIVNNGEKFPTSGYISGDYYFIDYSKTKMAYKLK